MTDFYDIPALVAPAEGTVAHSRATGMMDVINIGTGRIAGGEMKSGKGEVCYTDTVHGIHRCFTADTFAAAYFEAVIFAESMK